MRIKAAILILMVFIISPSSYAGWVLTDDSESANQTTYVQDNKLKLFNPDQIVIFNVAQNQVCLANPKQKTFWKGTPAELAAQGNGIVNNMEKMMDEQLSGLPIEARKAVSETIKEQIRSQTGTTANANSNAEVRDSGQTENIAGYKARKYEIRINGRLAEHLWISNDIQMGKDFDVKKFAEMLRSFTSGFGMAGERAALASPQVVALLEKGWPLRIIDYQGGGDYLVSDVVKVEKKSLPPATFDIPKEYRKVSVMEFFVQ
jgi:hypothetical protein